MISNAIIWLAPLAGFGLSVVSLLKICSACSETANYQVFGFDFGWFGIAYFAVLIVAIALRRRFSWSGWCAALLLFAAAGAETRFVWIQEYEIGQWCPICLFIAAAVSVACIGVTWHTFELFTRRRAPMKSKLVFVVLVSVFFISGLGGAIMGVKQQADAAELDLFLGKTASPTTVYFVTDWFCPSCIKAEPAIEGMFPELAKSVRVSFVDFPIHKETLNFTPYNLQFLKYEKAHYIELRRALADLALKTKKPSEEEVQAAVAPLGVLLRTMDNADILYGLQSNLTVYRGYNVKSTPTVVVTNSKTKKTKLLGGIAINEQAIKASVAEVENDSFLSKIGLSF
ncbi:MAG: vitamin K epoxide reductase family protein [Candidatus Geothermincolia bacterium]